MCPGIGILTFYSQQGRNANGPVSVPFVPIILQASWSTSRCYSSVIPKVLSGLLRYTCVPVRVCLRRVLHQRWPVHFHVLFLVARLTMRTFCPQGWVLLPGVCHHGSAITLGSKEMAMSPPRRACLFVHVAQSVPQVRAVPTVCSKVFWS